MTSTYLGTTGLTGSTDVRKVSKTEAVPIYEVVSLQTLCLYKLMNEQEKENYLLTAQLFGRLDYPLPEKLCEELGKRGLLTDNMIAKFSECYLSEVKITTGNMWNDTTFEVRKRISVG